MRVDVKKALFIGSNAKKGHFFSEAQILGLIDFIEKKGKKATALSDRVLEIIQAIKVLRTLNPTQQFDSVSPNKVQEVVLLLNESHRKLEELFAEQNAIREKLEFAAPFGSFSVEKIRKFERESGLFVQYFAIKKTAPLEIPENVAAFKAGMSEDLDYYFSIGKSRFSSSKIIEIEMKESKDDLQETYLHHQEKIHDLEKTLKECSHYNDAVHHLFLEQLNVDHLIQGIGKAQALIGDNVFVAAGWVPLNKSEEIGDFCKKEGVLFHEIKADEHEVLPTHLENEGLGRIGEDLVHIYDTPANNDKDPSLWVLCFFSLFFAIIVGDAGYGLIYLLVCLYVWWKHPKVQGFKRRVLTLSTILSAACIVWGILAGAYFGIPLSQDNPLKKYSLIQYLIEKKASYHIEAKDDIWKHWIEKFPQLEGVHDPQVFLDTAVKNTPSGATYEVIDRFTDNIMLELALFVGVVHIIFSMARYALRHWALFGWIIFMIGAYLWITAQFNYTSFVNFVFDIPKDTAATVGKQLTIGGLIVAIVCAFIQDKWYGILEINRLISILADTLSYLRLYALGMAGGILAATINGFAESLPLVIGLLLAFLAHTFNMALGIMSGVIHGLRLNFLEWYHYSFYGGGKQFKPLRILTKDD